MTKTTTLNPYVGPRTFERADAQRFFGRETEARDLLALAGSQRLVLFYAQSGAGKSSLINTRLAPQLEARGLYVLPVGRVGGELPAGVTAVENIYLFNLMLSLDQGRDGRGGEPTRLVGLTLGEFLHGLTSDDGRTWYYDPAVVTDTAADTAADANADDDADDDYTTANTVLIIDQFEEIITTHADRWPERAGFFQQLDAAMQADPRLRVVMSLREDYVASLDPFAQHLADKLRARFYMERMGVDAALLAVQQPAADAGRPFAPGVAAQLVDDLRKVRVPGQVEPQVGQYVEPVQLQVVCYQLWENLQGAQDGPSESSETAKKAADAAITFADLQAAGDVDSALAAFYETAISQVVNRPELGVSEQQLRTWFSTRLITEAGTRGTVFRDERSGLTAGLPNAAVEVLARQFLLRTELRAGGAWVELVHDRFVAPILRANRARQTPLALDAEAWLAAGKDAHRLYQNEKLSEALLALERHPEQFGDKERAFLEASQKAQTRRDLHQRRIILGVAVALVLLMSALAGAALWNARQAYEAQRIAESKAAEAASAQGKAEASAKITAEKTTLAEREKARADEEAARASLLAQEAAAARSDQLGVLAQAALRNGALPESLLLAVEAISNTLKASAPGSAAHLLTVDRVFYEAMVGLDATPNLFHGGRLYDVAFSPDNRMLATAGADNTIKLWSTTDPLAAPVVLTGHTGTVFDIEFGRNGSLLASAGADGLVGLWRMGDAPSLLRLLPGHTDGVARVAFSKDGNWLASASSDSTIRLWNVARLPVLNDAAVLRGHRGRVAFVTFSPDSSHLASSGEDGIVWLWDMGDPGVAPLRFDKGASVASVAFSPDGARLAAGGADSSISIWQAANPKVSPQQLAGHSGGISSLTFSPDGQWLASADFQGTVILWAAQPSLSEIARRRHNAGVDYIAFSDKSEWLATTDRSGAVELVFMRAPRAEPIRVHGHNDFVFSADFSGDDHWLASAGFDGLVRLYPLDLADQVRMACATTGRNFTNEEWTRHFGAAPYHLTCAQWPVHDTIAQAARDKAVQLAMSGQLVEAAEQFRHYLQLAPEIALDPAVEAKRIYDEAQAQEFLTRGNALARALDVEGAIALFREAQHFDPALIQDAEAEANRIAAGQLVAQANQTAQTLDLPGVTALLEQAAALDPATVAAPAAEARRLVAAQTVSAATVLAANGNLDDAVHSYETALALGAELELEPRLAAQVAYGRGLLGRNAYLDALAALDTSLVISPSFNVTNSLIAAQWDSICHFGNLLDRAADALPACGRAVALRADYADFHANHAIALALIDDLPGAISALERYLALAELTQSDDAAVLIARRGWLQALRAGVNPIRASILTRTGQYEAAAPIYTALWQLNPPILYTPDEMNNICWYGTLAGHAVDVLYMCDWALLLRPTTANYYDSRGLARAATGDLAGAAQDFDRYLYAGGTVPDVTRQRRQAWVIALRAGYNPVLAHIQVYNGDLEPALVAYKAMRAAELSFPADEWNHLCWLGARDGRAAQVLFACDLAVEIAPNVANYHDSRGLARALAGNFQGAVEDYRLTVAQADPRFTSSSYLARRQAIIWALEFLTSLQGRIGVGAGA